MPNYIFQEIERLHAEWSRMEKAAKLGWLAGEKIRLNRMMYQLSQYIHLKGGFSNNEERAYARKLIEMAEGIDVEGSKVWNDLADDAFKEIVKSLMR